VEPGCITPFVFLSEAVSKDIVVAISRELMFEKHLNFQFLQYTVLSELLRSFLALYFTVSVKMLNVSSF
jgi:hypothetical protein